MANIQVDPNSYVPALTALVRSGLVATLSFAGATGYISDDDTTKIASAVVAGALILYGAYKSYRNNENKKVMERFTPDSVAELKK